MNRTPSELTVECITPDALTEADRAGWQALRAQHPHGMSPLLSPAFAEALACVRSDVRVIIARRQGVMEACLAVHQRPFGLARPVGAPFDDLSGPLIAPGSDVTLETLVSEAGLGMFRANNAILPVGTEPDTAETPYLIDIRGTDGASYLESRRRAYPKRFKNFRRLGNKLERDVGEVRLEWGRADPYRLARVLGWKSDQFRRHGLLDITQATHSRAVLDAIASRAPGDPDALGGFMVTLHCNEALIAGHFGVREGGHFHPWISAYEPQFAEFAPGMVMLKRAIASMDKMGLTTYQLASGHGYYKKYFAEPSAPIAPVSAASDGFFGTVHATADRARHFLEGEAAHSVGARFMRRVDHIAACEPGSLARTRALANALVRRSHAIPASGRGTAA